MQIFFSWRKERWFLWTLFIINLVGTIYGFYWYQYQLEATKWYYLIFVPDSPSASLFFTGVLFLFLVKKNSPLLEALAAITLFKYGIWAVSMIIWGAVLDPVGFFPSLTWEHYMLMISHFGMAVQALLYAPFFVYRYQDILIVSVWTLLNDALDYGLDIHPWLSPRVETFHNLVGWFTLLLSLFSIILFSLFLEKRKTGNTSNL
jgi:uncharacterized membrane protein YpjA